MANILVKRLSRHTGLDSSVHVSLVHRNYCVHPGQIEQKAAAGAVNVSLHRRTGAVGHNRDPMLVANSEHRAYFLRRFRKGDSVGRLPTVKTTLE